MHCPDCGLPVYVYLDGKRTTIQKIVDGALSGKIKYVPSHDPRCASVDNWERNWRRNRKRLPR